MDINLNELTEKELIILTEVIKGKTNEEIGNTFFISKHTVKAHIKKILSKTKLKHRCQLISKVLTNFANLDLNSPILTSQLLKQNLNITK